MRPVQSRSQFGAIVGLAFLAGMAASLPLAAQTTTAAPRVVAYLGLGPSGSVRVCMDQVRTALQEAGWSVGDQVVLEWHDAGNDPARLASLAQELVARRPDVLLATSNPSAQALMDATREVPIVVMSPTNLHQVVDAQLRPTANVTGVTLGLKSQYSIKMMEVLLQAFPQARRIGMISNRGSSAHEKAPPLGPFADILDQAGVEGLRVRFAGQAGIAAAWDELARLGVDAVLIWPDSSVFLEEHARQARRVGLPAIAHNSWFATRYGGLLSYGAIGRVNMCGRGGHYVDQVLRGRPLRELPVEELYEGALVVNLATAEHLGVALPPALIARADRLIRPGERTLPAHPDGETAR